MPTSAPPVVLVRVTALPVPTFLSANTPVALTVTASPLTKPVNMALVWVTVAAVPPSYTRLSATRPEMVKALGVMRAVVLAWLVMV